MQRKARSFDKLLSSKLCMMNLFSCWNPGSLRAKFLFSSCKHWLCVHIQGNCNMDGFLQLPSCLGVFDWSKFQLCCFLFLSTLQKVSRVHLYQKQFLLVLIPLYQSVHQVSWFWVLQSQGGWWPQWLGVLLAFHCGLPKFCTIEYSVYKYTLMFTWGN